MISIAITKFLILYTCEVRFYDGIYRQKCPQKEVARRFASKETLYQHFGDDSSTWQHPRLASLSREQGILSANTI